MRILLVHDYGTLNGGAEVMIVNLRDELRARGHSARLFTSTARPLPLPVVADETCFGSVGPLRRGLQAFNPHARHRLRQVLKEFQPDVVLVKMFLTQLSPLILPLLREVPSVLSVVNYNLVCPLNTKTLPDGSSCFSPAGRVCKKSGCIPWLGVARHAAQRKLMNLSVFKHIYANSAWVAARLQNEQVRVDSVVHNGVSERAHRPPLGDMPVVAYAGRLVPKKGVNVLISSMVQIRRHVPDARLLVVGDGPERSRLFDLANELGIGAAVDFVGHMDMPSMEKALVDAWVQVVPSVWEEPFGLVAAESMLRGTAVVASSSGGLTEQVIEGETGYLVPRGNARALAKAVVPILSNRDHAEALGKAGRRHALANFTFSRHVDQVEKIFDSLVSP